MNKTMPMARSLVIAGCVAIGIAAVWLMVSAWFEGIIYSAMQGRGPYESIYLTVAGEPVLVRTTSGSSQTTEKILSLSGDPLDLTSQDLLYPQMVEGPSRRPLGETGQAEWQSRLVAANDGGVPPTYWYLVHDGEQPGHAYGVGYHAPTQTVIGFFGRSGFADALPQRSDWFEIAGYSGLRGQTTLSFYGQEPRWSGATPRPLMLADGKLWKVDLVKRRLIKLSDSPDGYRVGMAHRILENPPRQPPNGDQRSAASVTPVDGLVREPESLLIVNQASGESKRYPLPAELRRHQLATAQLPDGNLLLIGQRSYNDADEHMVWLKPSGEIAKQQTIHRKPRWQQPSMAVMGWCLAVDAPLPVANAAATLGWMPYAVLSAYGDEEADSYAQAMGIVLWRTWPSILFVLAAGCVAAWLAYRRQKRFGLPNPAAWAAFAFLFGVPGWIAYRFHRAWPVLEECPSCRQASPRDREECLECGKGFPPPPLKGIEVFA